MPTNLPPAGEHWPCGGVILCGGQSQRMGRAKAWLPLGPETLLERVVRIAAAVVTPVAVVAAAGQPLPRLPSDVQILRDSESAGGPLVGLHDGLAHLAISAEIAFVAAVDAPLLSRAVIEFLIGRIGSSQAAVVRDANGWHPLLGVYRCAIATIIESQLRAQHRSLQHLLATMDVTVVTVEELRAVDPDLDSLVNCNTPAEYAEALQRCGLTS